MKILEFLQEDNGGFSASRLAFLLWIVGVLMVWLMTSVKSGSLQEIPDSVATVMGILMTGKVVQKCGEKLPTEQTEDKPTENAGKQPSQKTGNRSSNNEEEHAGE